jgi:hypothetical protein
MRVRYVAARLAVACGTVLAALALAGAGGAASAGAASAVGAVSAMGAGAGTATPAAPLIGPVPEGFVATSVTFTSPDEAYVLGTAPCVRKPCGSIVRTLNRGASWVGIPAPVVPIGGMFSTGPAAWGIRFATAARGFVFGDGLWETTNGGASWTKATFPGASILSLEIVRGEVLAVIAPCTPGRCTTSRTSLYRRAVSGGGWHLVTRMTGYQAFRIGSIATYAGVAAVLDGNSVLVTTNGGRTLTRRATGCTPADVGGPAAVAVTGPKRLALLCEGQGAAGSVGKTVYTSTDLGVRWAKAGSPPLGGVPTAIAGTSGHFVVAAASGASELYYSANGSKWSTAYYAGDGGAGFADLGFTTESDGVAVHGPVNTDGSAGGLPGQLLLTDNGGATWHVVRF